MKTILLAIDFSEGIDNCCNYAVHIAGKFDAKIILFHSYFDKFLLAESNFPTGIETDTLINQKILNDIKSKAESDLLEIKKCILNVHPKLDITQELSGGNPDEEIIAAAENNNADLIILGSSGKAEKGVFSGSVSKKIMDRTTIPVLSIPSNFGYEQFSNVLYPTEFKHDDLELIKNIYDLFSKFNLKIYCLHLSHSDSEDIQAQFNTIRSGFKNEISEKRLSLELIITETYNEVLQKYIADHKINLIAFVAHKRGFLKEIFTDKLTKKDLFQLHLPMLAIKR